MARLNGISLITVAYTVFSVAFAFASRHSGGKDDPHGGVPMGVPNHFCDDGKSYTHVDWNSTSSEEFTCSGDRDLDLLRFSSENCEKKAKRPVHVCYPQEIHYDEDIPTSGRHRPLWPRYGEYKYLPPQRWLHSLEHGAVVFLYNPCANEIQIEKFKALARLCLRRHIITPSKRIPHPNMFAVVTWQCKLIMTHPLVTEIVKFIREHALHAPESLVYTDGQYSQNLTRPAKLVTDNRESTLCPDMSSMIKTGEQIAKSAKNRQHYIWLLKTLKP